VKRVNHSEIHLIPVGSIILVRLDDDPTDVATVWEVINHGKAVVMDEHYPHGETEDLDWLIPADIYIVGTTIPF